MSKKEKAQVHSGYRSAVFSTDTSGCIALGGILSKKNSHGYWQKRYFYFNNEFLIYKKDKGSSDIKGVIDLGELAKYNSCGRGELSLVMKGGEVLDLKGSDEYEIAQWIAAIEERMQWVEKDLEIINASHELPGDPLIAPDTLLVSGWLMKKSPHPYGGMQERFVRVEGTYLKYFKNEGRDKDALGSVSLETADWVRPYDSSPECKVFEVQAQKRVFTFQAESASEMHRWVSGIEEGIKCAKKLLERHALAKEVAATPFRIRLFDEKGATELRSLIREDLEELYPTDIPPAEGEEWVRVGDHLVAACQILDYLDDLLMEVAKVTGSKPKPMRLDVLAVGLLEINSFLSLRLTPVVTPELMVPSQINLGDVHNVIDWLTNYQARLSDIYCPPLEPDGPDPLSFPLIDNIPQLCEWYVRGAPGLVGAATHLKEHAKKVWDTLEENPAETLETHQDGTFYTHAPTDTWELFHHHISLATSTKAPLLEFMVAETIVENIEFVIQLMTSYVEGMYKPNPDANYREIELELVCGLVNDLQLHKNELDAVTKKFTWLDEIKRRVDALFEVEAANIKYTTLTCLRRISALIMEDIDEPLQEIFTPTWLGTPPPTEPPVNPSSQISVAIATINDYLNDLKQFVVSNRYPDLVDLVMEALVIRYFRSVMKIQDSPSPTKPREKKGTMFGKELSIKGMLGQGLRATEISVTLIENDTNAIHDFFKPKSDNVKAYWTVLDDLVQLLIMDPEEMSRLLMSRISQCPPAAQAIVECSKRCAALRDDLERDEVESIFLPLEPMLKVHNELEVDNEYLTLCGLYCNLGLTQKKSTLSRKLLSMATVPLIRGASMQESSSSPMPQDRHQQFQKSDAGRTSNVDDVLSVLKSDEDVRRELIREEEEEYEQRRIEEEEEALQAERANLYKEGWMEKKSPARHSTWQLRWFKLSTRAQQGDEGLVYTHTLFWYKKKGASSLKCHDTTSICGMQLLSSPRSLAYLTDDFNIYLAHDPEGMRGVPIKEWDAESKDGEAGPSSLLTQTHGHSFSFLLQLEGGDKGVTGGDKDVILRVKTVDDLIDWMNCLSTAAKLEYDVVSGVWMKGERKKKINPKAFLKATSLPKDARKKAALARSVSAVSTNHSSATAAARAPSALSTLDSFGDELMEEEDDEDEEDLDEEDGGEEVEEDGATERTVLHLEGTLEKQSPKNNLVWQPRYFKLVTRGPAGGTEYVLTWYKKRGASAIKSFNAGAITTMVLLRSPKPVVYNPDDFKLHMSREDRTLSGVVVKEKGSDTTSSSYIFMLSLDNSEVKGGAKKSGTEKDKDVLLRIDSAEKLINWMNCLAEAASLEYDSLSGCWVKGNRIKKTNPKAFLKSSTMPLPESHDASRHTLPRSASATATAGSTVPSMPSIEDEDDYAEEDNEYSGLDTFNSIAMSGESQQQFDRTSDLYMEGLMEKQSPKNNLVWQLRFFKLVESVDGKNYIFSWHKKQNDAALKSFSAGAITMMMLLRSPKPVVYNPDDFKLHTLSEDRTLSGVVVKEKGSDTTSSSYIFMLSLDNSEVKGGTKKSGTDKDKDVLLRIDSAEKLINWMNCLAEAASLEYDSLSGCWIKGNRIKKTNPKAFLKSSTMPLPESHDASRHTLPRSASATATAGSTVPSMPSIEDEDDYAEEEDNEGDDKSYQVDEESHQSVNSGEWNSDGDIAPPPPPPSSPPPSSPPSTQSPKQMLSTKPVETTSENVTDRLSDGSRDLHSFNSGNPRRSSNESVDDSLRNGSSAVGSDNGIECADGEEASGIDVGGIVLSGSENNSDIYPMHERESDIYSLASEGIPDDDEDDELRGDGSKPVGCTSCAVM